MDFRPQPGKTVVKQGAKRTALPQQVHLDATVTADGASTSGCWHSHVTGMGDEIFSFDLPFLNHNDNDKAKYVLFDSSNTQGKLNFYKYYYTHVLEPFLKNQQEKVIFLNPDYRNNEYTVASFIEATIEMLKSALKDDEDFLNGINWPDVLSLADYVEKVVAERWKRLHPDLQPLASNATATETANRAAAWLDQTVNPTNALPSVGPLQLWISSAMV
jgi:hypothetical protein